MGSFMDGGNKYSWSGFFTVNCSKNDNRNVILVHLFRVCKYYILEFVLYFMNSLLILPQTFWG